MGNEEDEELKQFAEDDQGDMSAGECDGELVDFLIYFVRTDHCFGVIAPGLRPKQRQVDCALFLFESEGDEFDYC